VTASMHSTPASSQRARWKVAILVSLVLILGLFTAAWQAGLLRPGCTAYLQSRPEVGMLPPNAVMVREDLTGDGHGAIALSGGDPGAFLVSSPALGPAYARWDFTMPVVDQATTDDVVKFYGSRLGAQRWTTAPDSLPKDWTWRQGDLSFRLNAPQPNGDRAQSLVSWTRSWEVTETIGGERAQPPECNWDGKETASGHVAQGIHIGTE
jgi:hypothetical protein